MNQAIVGRSLSTWFTSEYKKSGKKLDMGKGCVRFKSLEDLALDVVGRTVARVSAEEHMANYRAARALMGKGRNAGEGAAGLSNQLAASSAPQRGRLDGVSPHHDTTRTLRVDLGDEAAGD